MAFSNLPQNTKRKTRSHLFYSSMIVSTTPHNLVAKFIIDMQGRFYYTSYPKKEVPIKKNAKVSCLFRF
jgi:hypothetical protein